MINISGIARAERDTLIPRVSYSKTSKSEQGEIIAKTLINPFSPYKIVHLYDKPVSFDTYVSGQDLDVRTTRGIYTITYVPVVSRKDNRYAFRISQDLIDGTFGVKNWGHWCALCRRIPELAWINRNTTISSKLFGIALEHPGLGIQFVIDYPRYCALIEKRAKQDGIDIDKRPLVAFRCSEQAFNDKYRFKTIETKKKLTEFKDVFKSVEHDLSNTVQEEEE